MKLPSVRFLSISIIIFMILQIPLKCSSQLWKAATDNPVELGLVHWERDYDQALKLAKKENKPIFILFQEVPGCSTCTTYGKEVMSHPLLVETIETFFVPLCIYNNKKGPDAQVLKKYLEPSWNNPVVRITDPDGHDLINRVSSTYSLGGVVDAVVRSLYNQKINIPEYLNLLLAESTSYELDELVLGMYCFWSGEKAMARIDGVRETEAGFMGGKEVVRVKFDPEYINKKDLVSKARKANCADVVFDNNRGDFDVAVKKRSNFRKDPETKYYLFNSKYKSIPMTSLQSLKVNLELAQGGRPDHLLSPRQIALLGLSQKNYIATDISKAWKEIGW